MVGVTHCPTTALGSPEGDRLEHQKYPNFVTLDVSYYIIFTIHLILETDLGWMFLPYLFQGERVFLKACKVIYQTYR